MGGEESVKSELTRRSWAVRQLGASWPELLELLQGSESQVE